MKSLVSLLGSMGLTASALAQEAAKCAAEVTSNDRMQFNVKELVFRADCPEITVTLTHVGQLPKKLMGHNLVISRDEDVNTVMAEAKAAGPSQDYLKADSPLVIAATKMLAGGESETIKFPGSKLQAGVSYAFFCSFPGHLRSMRGTIVVEPAPSRESLVIQPQSS